MMKKLIGLLAFAFVFLAAPAVQAADMDDVTMTVMDVNDDHASDVTNEIEMPEQANEHASASSDNGEQHAANEDQGNENEQESQAQEQEQEQLQEQEQEQESQVEGTEDHQQEAHDEAQDEIESNQNDTESGSTSGN